MARREWEKIVPWQAKYMSEAFSTDKHFHVSAVANLANAKTLQEYKDKLE